jgi:NDMA-dependent alcohol dehydrogenase
MKTRAAVIRAVGKDWDIVDVDLEDPQAGEVVVRMTAAGVCHSDDHYRSGDSVPSDDMVAALVASGGTPRQLFPLIGGHEGAGVVEKVGPEVHSLAVGDHVAVSFVPACGRCRWCATGLSFICDRGAALFQTAMVTDGSNRRFLDGEPVLAMMQVGTFSEHVVASEDSFVKIDPAIPAPVAALVSCGVSTGWGSAAHRAGTVPGDTVVVLGVGGVGMNAVQGARAAGARHVIAVDPVEWKRRVSGDFGATHSAASAEEAIDLVRNVTQGVMAQRVIVCPGVLHTDLMSAALTLTAKAGVCVVVAVAPLAESTVPMSLVELTGLSKEIRGSLFGGLNPRESVPRLLGLYQSGALQVDELITRNYTLDDINEAFADMREGRNLRGVITFAG